VALDSSPAMDDKAPSSGPSKRTRGGNAMPPTPSTAADHETSADAAAVIDACIGHVVDREIMGIHIHTGEIIAAASRLSTETR
jgi:hypothetical protein